MNFKKLKSVFLENILIGLGVAGSIFLIVVVLLPSLSSVPSLRGQVASNSEELRKLKIKSSKLNSVITNQATLKSSLKIVDAAVPSKDSVPTLMTQIQRMASESGVTLKALQFGSGTVAPVVNPNPLLTDKAVKKVILQAVAEGPFTGLQSFLRNIEGASRIISVDNVSFESRKSSTTLTSNIGLTSYYVDSFPDDPLFSFDLSSPDLKSILVRLKTLKIYETEVTFSGVGKANPFD